MNKIIPWVVTGGAVLVLAVFVGGYLLTREPSVVVSNAPLVQPLETKASTTIAVAPSTPTTSVAVVSDTKSSRPASTTSSASVLAKQMSPEEYYNTMSREATRKNPFNGSSCQDLEEKNKVSFRGLDENQNGVRDDIDCLIKELFASDRENYIAALRYAKALQAMLDGDILYTKEELQDREYFKNSNEPRVQQFTEVLECMIDSSDPKYAKLLDKVDLIDYAMTNTAERSRAYGTALAGSIGGDVEQKYCHRTWMDSVMIK